MRFSKNSMGYSFNFKFTEDDIDFSPKTNGYYNYDKFLINEFFNSTDFEFYEIMKKYRTAYGDSAYNYVVANYCSKWRTGNRALSNIQFERIINIMKDSLNDSAKEKLIAIKEESRFRLGIEETLSTIKKTVVSFFSSQQLLYHKSNKNDINFYSLHDIVRLYKLELNRIDNLEIKNDRIFERIYVLDNNEIAEVLNISKYIIHVKLQTQIKNIVTDLNVFSKSSILKIKGINTFHYELSGFKNQIDLVHFKFDAIDFDYYKVDEVETNSKYKVFADKYLSEELAGIASQSNKDLFIRRINEYDISFLKKTILSLIESERDIKSETIFSGSGGVLKIKIDYKNIKKLQDQLLTYYIIILFLIACVTNIYYYFYTKNQIYDAIVITIFSTIFLYSLIEKQFKKLTDLRAEIRKYS